MMKTCPPPHIHPSQHKVVMHHLSNVASREEVTSKKHGEMGSSGSAYARKMEVMKCLDERCLLV